MILLGTFLLVVILLCAVSFQYLAWYQRWETRSTVGMAYFGKPLAQRRALKERIRHFSRPIMPLVKLLSMAVKKQSSMPGFEYEGVYGPPKVSSPEVFERAKNYQPTPEDVFVATQMRCGTTWMQQIVYEIVNRGQGDLSDKGHGHLYAVSPWIDAINSVALADAPLVGERPTRIIKTHLPPKLCPYSEQAKYIYVTRHPVSCFASLVDYNRTLLGPFMPDMEKMVEWFCSDRMYWLPWPQHVAGWWHWAQSRANVLFIHYEEMTASFAAVLDRVADFLGYQLTTEEKQRIRERCTFTYMKDNEELFEMSPPNMFSVIGGQFLSNGKTDRHQDVPPAIRERILDYCRQSLSKSDYPAHQFYPDLVVATAVEIKPAQPSALESSRA